MNINDIFNKNWSNSVAVINSGISSTLEKMQNEFISIYSKNENK